jgi:hypothetical protein
MGEFTSKSIRFLTFEVARLRTLYDNNPSIRDVVVKRYSEVKGELEVRGVNWFWNIHPLDKELEIRKRFIRPNKPAWRIFEAKEVFGITDFNLPVLVDIKIDGMRMQIHKEDGVHIYSEDEGFDKTSRFKLALKDIENLPNGTILDSEGVMVVGEETLHRTAFIGYVNGKGYDEEKDKQVQFWVFDILKWEGKDLMDLPLSERLKYLDKVKESDHIKVFKIGRDGYICRTEDQVLKAIEKVAGKKGSEGAMIKFLNGKYVKDVHNKTWVKLKNLKEVDCLVVEIEQPKHQKGPLEGKPVEGVYNYHVAAGPYSAEDGKVLLDKVPKKVREVDGKVYAYLGKTFNTEIEVKVGDVIRIWSPEINRYEVAGTDLYTYGVYEPKVLEWVHERHIPDSLNVLNRLAQETSELHPRENKAAKEYDFVIHRHYGQDIHSHWDLRWKLSPTHKQEVNIYHKPEEWKDKFTPARFKDFKESEESLNRWMVTEGTHLERHVFGVEHPTYIDVVDHGTLEVRDLTSDRLLVEIKGEKIRGLYEFKLTGSMEELTKGFVVEYDPEDPDSVKNFIELLEGLTKEDSNSMYLPRHSCMMVWSGIKTQIVKEKPFEGMLHKELYLCDDHYFYGEIELTSMRKVTREEVEKDIHLNRIFGEDWEDWKGAKTFYSYDFVFEAVFEPQVVNVPKGAQTFFSLEPEAVKRIEGIRTSGDYVGLMRKKEPPEYIQSAEEGEPLPSKFYKWENSGKEKKFRFVLQRHYPTGEKIPIKPDEKVPQMHKGEEDDLISELRSELPDIEENLERIEEEALDLKILEPLLIRLYEEDRILKIRDHLDLRMEISGTKLIGLTIHPPVPGGISIWDSFRSRMAGEEKTQVTPKFEHPHRWLNEEGELRFPTRHENQPGQEAHYLEVARMEILDKGEVKYGVQREDLHEYFFWGKYLKGRWVIRKLKIGTEAAHWAWLLMKPSDQKPLDPIEHRDSGYYAINQVKQPTTEERAHIEEETQAARAERGQKI